MRTRASWICVAIALAAAAGCRSASNPRLDTTLTPQADSALTCAERELFAHGYRVRRVPSHPLRLRAEPQLSAIALRATIVLVEYDPETQGLDVWVPVGPTARESLDASAAVSQVAWAVQDACVRK